MFTIYLFSLLVGGGFLALSVFGDFLDGMDIDVDVDADIGADLDAGGADRGREDSSRCARSCTRMFGFGATGAILHWVWGGTNMGLTSRRSRRHGSGRRGAHQRRLPLPEAHRAPVPRSASARSSAWPARCRWK